MRQILINHIIKMMVMDIDYARWALQNYNKMLPEYLLNDGVREKMKGVK